MAKSIFVSHISEEREIAAFIKRAMTDAFDAVAVFTSSDVGSVGAGDDWLNAVKKALARSAAIIVLCSQESINRPWVQFELGAAWMLKKRIIPICHSGLRTEHLSIPLSLLEAVELGTESGLRKLYAGVVKALRVKAERVPADMQELLREARALQRDLGVHQFEMYIDILIPRDELGGRIPGTARIESDNRSMELFGFRNSKGCTWSDIERAADVSADTRWLDQLHECVRRASRNEHFEAVQAIYHTGRGRSFQPQLAKMQLQSDGTCRFHVHLVETVVAPLVEVNNEFGLLATLLRLGMRFRYEVIEKYARFNRDARASSSDPLMIERYVREALRAAILVIERDAASRGSAILMDPDALLALFDRDSEREQIESHQALWQRDRALLFKNDPPPTLPQLDAIIANLRGMNWRFMSLATQRCNEIVSTRWSGDSATPVAGRRVQLAPGRTNMLDG